MKKSKDKLVHTNDIDLLSCLLAIPPSGLSILICKKIRFFTLVSLFFITLIFFSVKASEIDDKEERFSLPSPQNDLLSKESLITTIDKEEFSISKNRKSSSKKNPPLEGDKYQSEIYEKFPFSNENNLRVCRNPIVFVLILVISGVAFYLGVTNKQTQNFSIAKIHSPASFPIQENSRTHLFDAEKSTNDIEFSFISKDPIFSKLSDEQNLQIESNPTCVSGAPQRGSIPLSVIGAGYGGVLAALQLAKLRTINNLSVFEVHLFEKEPLILNGASIIPARLHLGGEYPTDSTTALQCLISALFFRQMLPTEAILTSRKRMDFLLSAESLKSQKLSLLDLENQYTRLKKVYSSFYEKFEEEGRQQLAQKLFGLPEEFFELLNSSSKIEDPQLRTHFSGGIRTPERGFQPLTLGVIFERLLKQYNVTIHYGYSIEDAIYDEERNGYNLQYFSKESRETGELFSKYVVNAAWHDIARLNYRASNQFKERVKQQATKVFVRSIGLYDVSECDAIPKDRSYFGLEGSSGGMVSFFSNKVASIYIPKEGLSWRDSIALDYSQEQSAALDINTRKKLEMLNTRNSDKAQRILKNILKDAKEKYPFLNKAKPLSLFTRTTLSWDNDTTQRQHIPTQWVFQKRKWLQACAVKATFAPVVALEILGHIVVDIEKEVNLSQETITFLKNIISKNLTDLIDGALEDYINYQDLDNIERNLVMPLKKISSDLILPSELVLTKDEYGEDPEFWAQVQLFGLTHQLPLSMVERFSELPPIILPDLQIPYIDWNNLQEIDLRSISANPQTLKAFAQIVHTLPKSKQFKSLRFCYYKKEEKINEVVKEGNIYGLSLLAALAEKTLFIETLEIDQLWLSVVSEAESLRNILHRCRIKNLILTGFASYITEDGDLLLSLDSAGSQLTTVKILFKEPPSEKTFIALLHALRGARNLKEIRMPQNQIGAVLKTDGFRTLAQFIRNVRHVNFIDLSNNQLFDGRNRDNKFEIFEAIFAHDNLNVDLSNNGLTLQEIEELHEEKLRKKRTELKKSKNQDIYNVNAIKWKIKYILDEQIRQHRENHIREERKRKEQENFNFINLENQKHRFELKSGFLKHDPFSNFRDYVKPSRLFQSYTREDLSYFDLLKRWAEKKRLTSYSIPEVLLVYEAEDQKYADWICDAFTRSGLRHFSDFCYEGYKGHSWRRDNIQDYWRFILIGSPRLKEKYEARELNTNNKDGISYIIDHARKLEIIRQDGNTIIPIYFSGTSENMFPTSLQHIPARFIKTYDSDFECFWGFLYIIDDIFQYSTRFKTSFRETYFRDLVTYSNE